VVLAEDGTPLRSWPGADGAMRHRVELDQVSPLYVEAVLGYEDRAFWHHPGVNPLALVRAAWQWARAGQVVSGGSTLTMQVARLLDPDCADRSRNLHSCATRNMGAKLRQIARAFQLEWHLSKREILTLYLNEAPMGGMVEGVEMAARAYLGKPAKDLSHAEAALLAVLPQSPSRLRPDRYAAAAQQARDKLMDRMQESGRWSAAEGRCQDRAGVRAALAHAHAGAAGRAAFASAVAPCGPRCSHAARGRSQPDRCGPADAAGAGLAGPAQHPA